jgi:hypothetical protein
MLFRADHRKNSIGGPAAVTNGGNAMLVMRNYGYLGLQTVVDSKSSLARDRLVDFTGELQLRRRTDDETEEESAVSKKDPFVVNTPSWRSAYTAEPCIGGGRIRTKYSQPLDSEQEENSALYAQEVASVPIQLTPSVRSVTATVQQGNSRGKSAGHDIEPFYGTCFCNEMLFHPRLLHNCPRGNLVMKVELRELEWSQRCSSYLAHLPRCGPSIHNNRRGPFLVQSSLTSCAPRGSHPHFIDEFKLKLPLDLKPQQSDEFFRIYVLLFTVYKVKTTSKNKWKRAKNFFSSPSGAGEAAGDTDDTGKDSSSRSRLEQVACGFLPISTNFCIIDNGMHDVKVVYVSKPVTKDIVEQGLAESTALRLIDKAEGAETVASTHESIREDSTVDENMSIESGFSDRNQPETSTRTENSTASVSDMASVTEDSQSRRSRSASTLEQMSLSVRIVLHSSLHSPIEILTEFLDNESDSPRVNSIPGSPFLSTIKLGRKFILDNVQIRNHISRLDGEERLLEATIDITKHQMCSLAYSTSHLLRIMPVLWRHFILGTGMPDLHWANPAIAVPLRIHSFASILHLLGSVSLYMSKNGAQQLDGSSKWNVATTGRILALLFDEESLFGAQACELIDEKQFMLKGDGINGKTPSTASSESTRKKRHVRQVFEFGNSMFSDKGKDKDKNDGNASFDVTMTKSGTVALGPGIWEKKALVLGPSTDSDSSILLHGQSASTRSTKSDEKQNVGSSLDNTSKQSLKIDTKHDFQSALRAAAASADDFDKPSNSAESTENSAASAFLMAFADNSRTRHWMTAPLPLSTIREGEDRDGDDSEISEELGLSADTYGEIRADRSTDSKSSSKTLDSRLNDLLDNELIVSSTKKSVKQMRVPKTKRLQKVDETSASEQTFDSASTPSTSSNTDYACSSIPPSEQQIESAGTAFLDAIGKSLGIRYEISNWSVTLLLVGLYTH